MKHRYMGFSFAMLLAGIASQSYGMTTIYSDNFTGRTPNPTTLDTTPAPGELGGLLASSVVMKSQDAEQNITNNELQLVTVSYSHTTSVRFSPTPGSGSNWDFSSGAAGAQIIADGGMDISFDWTAPSALADEWIAFSVGTTGGDYGGNSGSGYSSLIQPSTDAGVLLRNAGNSQLFIDGSGTNAPGTFPAAPGTNHVDLQFLFNSWAPGAPVTLNELVDGNLIGTEAFTWGHSYDYMELASYGANPLIANFAITSVPEPTSLALLGIGSLGLLRRRRQR